jgi:hypothetical protein
MTIRILTLAVPDGRQFYAVCNACGFLSMPLPEWELAERSGGRHVCRANALADRAC